MSVYLVRYHLVGKWRFTVLLAVWTIERLLESFVSLSLTLQISSIAVLSSLQAEEHR